MAVATENSYKNPEGNLDVPLSNLRFHRWNLDIANTNTHDTGLDNIVDYAMKVPLAGGAEVGVNAVTAAGVFTFDVGSGTITDVDLLVWTTQ